MVAKVDFKVHGLAEIERAMKELGTAASNRIARSSLNRGATPVVKRAKELAPTPGDPDDPYATGELKKAITKRLRRARRGSSKQEILVGIERPRSRIVHLLEFGSAHQWCLMPLRNRAEVCNDDCAEGWAGIVPRPNAPGARRVAGLGPATLAGLRRLPAFRLLEAVGWNSSSAPPSAIPTRSSSSTQHASASARSCTNDQVAGPDRGLRGWKIPEDPDPDRRRAVPGRQPQLPCSIRVLSGKPLARPIPGRTACRYEAVLLHNDLLCCAFRPLSGLAGSAFLLLFNGATPDLAGDALAGGAFLPHCVGASPGIGARAERWERR
jgi:Bacteriophage HK97-gp10, putative tail-component